MNTYCIKKVVIKMVIATTIVMSSAFRTEKNVDNQVMIYGIVYANECNSESFQYYIRELVDANKYYEKQKELEISLRKNYPNAKRIKMGSSQYDYGSYATNMCIIQWVNETSNHCSYKVIAVSFGKSQTEAFNRAIEKKNTWAGTNASYTIQEQRYW